MIRFAFLKRAGDVVLSATALVLLAPVFAVVWAAVRFAMGAPVLHADTRAGKDGRPIRILKFRSMREAAGADGRPLPDADRLGAGKKSFVVALRLRSAAGTLSGAEAKQAVDRVVEECGRRCGATLRA